MVNDLMGKNLGMPIMALAPIFIIQTACSEDKELPPIDHDANVSMTSALDSIKSIGGGLFFF